MIQNEKKYEKNSDEMRNHMEKKFYESVIENFRKNMVEANCYKYEVVLQDNYFVTYMTDEELRLSAKLSIDLLEELKEINNTGMNRRVFGQLLAEAEAEEKNEVLQLIHVWNRIATDNMAKLIAEIDMVRRVGGAWAILIANPGLISAICAVYERLVDEFEDEELYEISGFFSAESHHEDA